MYIYKHSHALVHVHLTCKHTHMLTHTYTYNTHTHPGDMWQTKATMSERSLTSHQREHDASLVAHNEV